MEKLIKRASKPQRKFWLKMFKDEVRNMEKRIKVKKEMIKILEKSLEKKK